jgi:hypothetical protein
MYTPEEVFKQNYRERYPDIDLKFLFKKFIIPRAYSSHEAVNIYI